jgi:hypothetical protein
MVHRDRYGQSSAISLFFARNLLEVPLSSQKSHRVRNTTGTEYLLKTIFSAYFSLGRYTSKLPVDGNGMWSHLYCSQQSRDRFPGANPEGLPHGLHSHLLIYISVFEEKGWRRNRKCSQFVAVRASRFNSFQHPQIFCD